MLRTPKTLLSRGAATVVAVSGQPLIRQRWRYLSFRVRHDTSGTFDFKLQSLQDTSMGRCMGKNRNGAVGLIMGLPDKVSYSENICSDNFNLNNVAGIIPCWPL